MATPTEHYREAELLLDEATEMYDVDVHSVRAGKNCALAKIHAQLALTGATLFAPSTHMPYPPNEALRLAAAMGGGAE